MKKSNRLEEEGKGESNSNKNSLSIKSDVHCYLFYMINIYESKFKNSKCWWCKNHFKSHPLGLPKCYSNNKFLLEGNFCSFNCRHFLNTSVYFFGAKYEI